MTTYDKRIWTDIYYASKRGGADAAELARIQAKIDAAPAPR